MAAHIYKFPVLVSCETCHGEGKVRLYESDEEERKRLEKEAAVYAKKQQAWAARKEFFLRIWDYVLFVGGGLLWPMAVPTALTGVVKLMMLWWVHVLGEPLLPEESARVFRFVHLLGLCVGGLAWLVWNTTALTNKFPVPWQPRGRRKARMP